MPMHPKCELGASVCLQPSGRAGSCLACLARRSQRQCLTRSFWERAPQGWERRAPHETAEMVAPLASHHPLIPVPMSPMPPVPMSSCVPCPPGPMFCVSSCPMPPVPMSPWVPCPPGSVSRVPPVSHVPSGPFPCPPVCRASRPHVPCPMSARVPRPIPLSCAPPRPRPPPGRRRAPPPPLPGDGDGGAGPGGAAAAAAPGAAAGGSVPAAGRGGGPRAAGPCWGLRGPGRGRRWALTPGRVPPAAPTPRWASSPEAPAVRAGRGRGLEPGQPWHP